jgi:hypothetical protein
MATHGKNEGAALAPLQYGVGIPAGAETIVHTMRTGAKIMTLQEQSNRGGTSSDDEQVVMAVLDCEKAFNTMYRGHIHGVLKQRESPLLPLFEWMYGSKSPLRFGDGSSPCDSETGVRQGDPLGSLLFALGLQPILVSVKEEVPTITIKAFIDDINIAGKLSDVIKAYRLIVPLLQEIGLKVNAKKTVLWNPSSTTTGFSEELGLTVAREGLKALGNPFGGKFGVVVDQEGADHS